MRQPIRHIILTRSRDIYELALLLGDELPDKIVGWTNDLKLNDRDAYDGWIKRYPSLANVPVLGSVGNDTISLEQVVALQPDAVIVESYGTTDRSKSLARIEEAGVPLLCIDLAQHPSNGPQQTLLLLGKVLGKEARAREIVAFVDAELEKVFSRLPGITTSVPSVYIEAGNLGPDQYSVTYGSAGKAPVAWGVLMEQVRCRNIMADAVGGLAKVDPEHLLQANPDVIVIAGARWTVANSLRLGFGVQESESVRLLRGFTTRPGWAELKAVKTGRVHGLFHGFSMHATHFAAVQQFAKWLYPEEFKDLDPQARLDEFHRRFMPLDCRGTWMVSLPSKSE